MLLLSGVGKTYAGPPAREVLAGVSLTVSAGEFVAIVGESGAGKSTLLNLIAALDRPDAGRITLEGTDLGTLDDDARTRWRRETLGFVFQAFHVLPYLDVAGNVGLPLLLLGIRGAEARSRVAEALAAVGLGDRGASLPRQLSGGELQRVAIARALVHRPRLLLADEPTGNLDPDNADQVIGLFHRTLKASGAAGVLVTHSARAAAYADRTLRLTRTGLVPEATPS